MRVISGKARGLKLYSPEGLDTRPTLDRVKEAVFSMLLPYLQDAIVLDLFAGSGALGIEALSRGAQKAYFIDNSGSAIRCINDNLLLSKFRSDSIVKQTSAENFLNNTSEKFDLIFLDPPYSAGLYSNILDLICKNSVLNNDGLILVEWDIEHGFSFNENNLLLVKEKKYGRVGISVLKCKV